MAEVHLGGPPTLTLQTALLIYKSSEYDINPTIAVTRHEVKGKQLQPGEAVDVDGIRELLTAGKPAGQTSHVTAPFTWHPVEILAENSRWRIWWTPPRVQPIVFIAGKPSRAWFPGLIWAGSRQRHSLYLWAFRGDKRPKPKTILYRPQFGPLDGTNHIHKDSAVCLGTMNPGRYTPADWMAAFFDTNFKTNDGLPLKPYEIKTTLEKWGTLGKRVAELEARQ